LRKMQLVERYQVVARSIDRWVEAGRLPKPLYVGDVPMWDLDEIEAAERAAIRSRTQ
jgi:predicted DNA-binding transcriptional regulator AlpA